MSDLPFRSALHNRDDAQGLSVRLKEIIDRGMIDVRGIASDSRFTSAAKEVLGFELPLGPRTSAGAGEVNALWLSVDQWLLTLPRGQADRVEYRLELAPRVFAPLTKSDRVGVLRALVDGKVVAEAPLHPIADVPRGNIFRRIWDTILSWFA